MSPVFPSTRLFATAMVAGLLVSCDSSGDPGMIEKVALLEAELRDRDQQLAAMQEEASASSTDTTTTPSASAPDLEAARAGYLGFVEGLRTKLAEAMPDAKFDRTSVFPVEGPDPSKPILSRVAFRIADKSGRTGEMVIPLFADPSGTWQEPETKEIVAGFKVKPAVTTPVVASTPPPAAPPAAPPRRPQPTDVMGANRTVEVQWDDGPAKPNGQAPPSPQPAPQPQPTPQPQPAPQSKTPPMPKKVMETSRDVIIDFE